MPRPALPAILLLLACATVPAMSALPRHRVAGTFEVQFKQEPPYDTRPGATLGRTGVEKQFQGPLTAESHVEMLGAMSEVKGSASYVALERVVGTLEGKAGSFVLQHVGSMAKGAMSLSVTVVPDTATGALVGLEGTMTIDIVEGQHHYAFEYGLPR